MFNYEESKTKAFNDFCEGVDEYVNEVDKTDGKYVDKDLLDNAIYNYETDMDIITKSYGISMYNDGFKNGQKDGEHHAFLVITAAIVAGAAVISVAGAILDNISKRKERRK